MGKKRRKSDGLVKETRRRAQAAGRGNAPRRNRSAVALPEGPLGVATQVDAWQFLLNYLSYVRDGGMNVPMDRFGPQRSDETVEDAELRLRVARTTKEVQALIGNWAELCAEVLDRETLAINPDVMVALVVEVGQGWLRKAGHRPNPDEWLTGARTLLGVLCAPQHWLDALNVLDQFGTMGIEPGKDPFEAASTAQAKPAAALHAASALVAWLYGQRAVVFDQTVAMRTLAGETHRLAESLKTMN